MIMPVFGYCGLIFLTRSQSYNCRIESIERGGGVVIRSSSLTVDLRIAKMKVVIKGLITWAS